MDEIRQDMEPYRLSISVAEFQRSNNYDFIKQIYEALIPKRLRHALGEYYTPDWLAESTLNSAIDAYGSESIRSISILDPTCGSGTFLFQAIAISGETATRYRIFWQRYGESTSTRLPY